MDVAEKLVEYQQRMRKSPQFRALNIEPKWVPGTGDIDGFIHDEVVRQYHDPRIYDDGGIRVQGMQAAWQYARGLVDKRMSPDDILSIAGRIEPKMNSNGTRIHNVFIGKHTGAPPELLPALVSELVLRLPVEPIQEAWGAHPNQIRNAWNFAHIRPEAEMFNLIMEHFDHIETADDWYLAFEAIHPFGDGNGRTGKVLHNLLMGTLEDPVLVADYFGGGNP